MDTELDLLRRLEKHTHAWFKADSASCEDAERSGIAQQRMANVLKKLKRLRKQQPKAKPRQLPARQSSGEHEKIEAIRQWAFDRDWFDTTFIDQLQEAFEKFGHLTPAQEQALDNIIERFGI